MAWDLSCQLIFRLRNKSSNFKYLCVLLRCCKLSCTKRFIIFQDTRHKSLYTLTQYTIHNTISCQPSITVPHQTTRGNQSYSDSCVQSSKVNCRDTQQSKGTVTCRIYSPKTNQITQRHKVSIESNIRYTSMNLFRDFEIIYRWNV